MHGKRMPVAGVIADVVVPYSSNEEVDWDCLRREVLLLDKCGVHGLCVGGVLSGTLGATPDELSSLCLALRTFSKTPLFAILFPDAAPEAIEMVHAVNDAGADVIAVAQPHYLSQPNSDGLADMFADLKQATDRPLFVADCLPGSILGVQAIRELAAKRLVDGVLEAADMHVLVDLLCLNLDIPVYSGVEDLHYLALVLGAHGVISDFATVFPSESVALYSAFESGDHAKARKHHERLVRLWRALNSEAETEARIRSALTAQGRNVGPARSPYNFISPDAAKEIDSVLQQEHIAAT
jgi:4-hydroxy-tetrahydrodipicolinate synthase